MSQLWQEAIKKSPTVIIRNVIFVMSSVPSLSLSLDGCRLFGPDLEWDMGKQKRIQSDCDGEGGLISSCKKNCLGLYAKGDKPGTKRQKLYDSTYRRDLQSISFIERESRKFARGLWEGE